MRIATMVSQIMNRSAFVLTVAMAATLTACGGGGAAGDAESAKAAPAAQSAQGPAVGPQTPDLGHQVISVEALTDDQGNNVFRPARIEAHRGDVIRFTLKSGVHNVHFLPDSNPGRS